MKRVCRELWEAIVALAEGKTDSQAAAHIAECPECRVKFEQLNRMVAAMAVEQAPAPASVIGRAKALMAGTVRRLSLLRTSLHLAGARSANQDFQAIYSGEGIELRVMYTKTDGGWEVVSKVPDASWSARRAGQTLSTDSGGRFSFQARTLDDSQFSLEASATTLEVPNIGESLNGSDDIS